MSARSTSLNRLAEDISVQPGDANPGSYLRQHGVDGRDEPGHDGRGPETQSPMAGPTIIAISANNKFSEIP
jgi:hypothetical protein